MKRSAVRFVRQAVAALSLVGIYGPTAHAAVLVTSRADDRVVVYSDAGAYIGDITTAGMDGPVGLRMNSRTGDLLITSNQNNTILRYDLDTETFLSNFASGGQLNGPSDLYLAFDGTLFVANFGTTSFGGGSTVSRFTHTGTPLANFPIDPGAPVTNPTGVITVAGVGYGTFISSFDFSYTSNSINRYDSSGAIQQVYSHPLLFGPAGLTMSGDNQTLYVASLLPAPPTFNSYNVLKFDVLSGVGQVILSGSELNFPSGIMFLGNDMLVSNSGDGKINRYTPDGFGGFTHLGLFNDDGVGNPTGGLAEASQMLHISDTIDGLYGDFDLDEDVDADDIDFLCMLIDTQDLYGDLNGDGYTTHQDLDYMVAIVLDTHYGDADLDLDVDGVDFDRWRIRDSLGDPIGWATGDFDCDGDVDGADFDLWRRRPQAAFGGGGEVMPVPEPASLVLLLGLAVPALGCVVHHRIGRLSRTG